MNNDHRDLVRRVKRYIIDAGPRPVRIPELCKRFRVDRRALFRAFVRHEDVTPIEFSRRHRLALVHAVLTRRKTGLIKDFAIAHGFLAQGRFTRNYRQLFGELPSETLARPRRKKRKR